MAEQQSSRSSREYCSGSEVQQRQSSSEVQQLNSSSSEVQQQHNSSSEVQQANRTVVIALESHIINLQLLNRTIEVVTQHVVTFSACHNMVAQSSDIPLQYLVRRTEMDWRQSWVADLKAVDRNSLSKLPPKPLD